MTYHITKEIKIIDYEDGFSYAFSTDVYENVRMCDNSGVTHQTIHIPKDCIQHVIDVLEQFK